MIFIFIIDAKQMKIDFDQENISKLTEFFDLKIPSDLFQHVGAGKIDHIEIKKFGTKPDTSNGKFLDHVEICNKYDLPFEITNLKIDKYKDEMKFDNNNRMIAHNCHIYQSKDYAINSEFDLLYFVEDDYIHEDDALIEMIYSYQKFTSQLNDEIILCPVDYPYLYIETQDTKNFIGFNKISLVPSISIATAPRATASGTNSAPLKLEP